ncbi:unnamed protein product [Enterobius vermicularis]|uniref:ANK_REP_REGION domain-containing protein n=1 Tax=Enterobius vermicularis TaxID=51028 RepID=A0A0N4VPG0_ENTVE|nr:unnamed protein product [Enterobius vermicularis]
MEHSIGDESNGNVEREYISTSQENPEQDSSFDETDKLLEKRLLAAAANGQLKIVQGLIIAEVNVNAQDTNKDTALHLACFMSQTSEDNHAKIVRYLISKGANVNAENNDKCTPWFAASERDNVDMVRYMAENGAEVICEDCLLKLLTVASQKHCENVKKYLKEMLFYVSGAEQSKQKLLKIAIRLGHINAVRYLVSKGAVVEGEDNEDKSSLFIACKSGHSEIVKYLIEESGCNINIRNMYGQTPVMIASRKGHLAIVNYLLEKGCSVAERSNDGVTLAESGRKNLTDYRNFFHGFFILKFIL